MQPPDAISPSELGMEDAACSITPLRTRDGYLNRSLRPGNVQTISEAWTVWPDSRTEQLQNGTPMIASRVQVLVFLLLRQCRLNLVQLLKTNGHILFFRKPLEMITGLISTEQRSVHPELWQIKSQRKQLEPIKRNTHAD